MEQAGRVHLLPEEVYWTCASKAKTHALAGELGIPVPLQVVVNDLNSLHTMRRRDSDPHWYLSPRHLPPPRSIHPPNRE